MHLERVSLSSCRVSWRTLSRSPTSLPLACMPTCTLPSTTLTRCVCVCIMSNDTTSGQTRLFRSHWFHPPLQSCCVCVVALCRTSWTSAVGSRSLRPSSSPCVTSMPAWLRGGSLVLKAGTGSTRSTLGTSPSLSTCSTITWRPTHRQACVCVCVKIKEKKGEKIGRAHV